jgi:hypothetical protein
MFKYLLCFMILLGGSTVCDAGPLQNIRDEHPRVDKVIRVPVPEVYDITIKLNTGEEIKLQRVALTPWSLKQRFSINSADGVLRVKPEGSDKMRIITQDQIEDIRLVRVKDKDKDQPQPAPVPAPAP